MIDRSTFNSFWLQLYLYLKTKERVVKIEILMLIECFYESVPPLYDSYFTLPQIPVLIDSSGVVQLTD